jgi:thiamine biosynthesis lipoprotein
MQRLDFRAMGSKMLALVDSEEAQPALNNVPAWFESWEQTLSRFRIDSELTRLNRRAGEPVGVSADLWEVFAAAIQAHGWTRGLVNPLVLEDMLRAGYDRDFEAIGEASVRGLSLGWHLPSDSAALPEETSDPADLLLDAPTRTLCLPYGKGLDFGGIAKGWAADQAAQRLGRFGPALVSAGGDIAVSSPRVEGEPWAISVDDPFRPGHSIETIYLESGGVATSGTDRRHWIRSGKTKHHIIDPRTGEPAETDVVTATVVASNAIRAEALAKASLILGGKAGLEWLERQEDAAALVVLQSGDVLFTRSMENLL